MTLEQIRIILRLFSPFLAVILLSCWMMVCSGFCCTLLCRMRRRHRVSAFNIFYLWTSRAWLEPRPNCPGFNASMMIELREPDIG